MRKQATIFLEYQPYIDQLPVNQAALYQQACSNDRVTVDSWRKTWIDQIKANHAIYGPFKNKSIASLYKKELHKPMILVGSGPSLKKNIHHLKNNPGIPVISCLHNFHYLEDEGINVDYYVSLDAGAITIEEVSEGGNPDVDYWAKTKDKKLLCYVGTHPNLLAKWQGEVYFFNAPIPDLEVEKEIDAVEKFKVYVSSGGNVLGACLYISKAILGSGTSIFLGADFSFSYEEKFHSWDTYYDKNLGHVLRVTDIHGVKIKSWQSYINFKAWFDWVAFSVPGEYINCTEGGIFGAYDQGNIRHVIQMDLEQCLKRFSMSDFLKDCMDNPETDQKRILF